MNYTIVYSIAWLTGAVVICGIGLLIFQAMQNDYTIRTKCIEQKGIYVYQVGCTVDKDIRP